MADGGCPPYAKIIEGKEMVKFCNDVDIARFEPMLFGENHLPWQVLAAGENGQVEGTAFSDSSADFIAGGVKAGGIIYMRSADGLLDGIYEIVSVDSATELSVSVIRSDSQQDSIAPKSGEEISYWIGTLEPQIVEAAMHLTKRLGMQPGCAVSELKAEDILDIEPLRQVSVFLVISNVYAILDSSGKDENFSNKSKHYRELYQAALERCRVSIDSDGDGVGDITICGGTFRMKRE